MTDLLISYFEKFGDKICCGNDLKLYLPNIDSLEIARFFDDTFKFISLENSNKRPSTVRIFPIFIICRAISIRVTLKIKDQEFH